MYELDHVGIAVRNLDETLELWVALGFEVHAVEETPEHGVRVAILRAGASNVELMEPLHNETPVGRFIAKRGEGMHHLAFKVRDIDDVLQSLLDKDIPLIDRKSRVGAGGARIAFVNPKAVNGCLIELTDGGHHG